MFIVTVAVSIGVFRSPATAEYQTVSKLAQERRQVVAGLDKKVDGLFQLERQLAKYLDSSDPKVRLAAVRGFFVQHSKITDSYGIERQVVRMIQSDPDANIRKEALALVRHQRSEETVLAVARCLTDTDVGVRDAAAYWFNCHPVRPDVAVPALVKYLTSALEKGETSSVNQAVTAFWSFGSSAADAVQTVLRVTEHPSAEVRFWAIRTLSHIARDRQAMAGEFGKRFVHAERKLYDPDRVAALKAAPNLGPAAVVFLPDYLRFFQDDVLGTRPPGVASAAHVATEAFRKLGPAAKNAIPELVKLTARADEKHPLRSELAACALRVGATKEADLKVLAKVFTSKDGWQPMIGELCHSPDRWPQFRRQADKLCELIVTEWEGLDRPLPDEVFQRSRQLADALGADAVALLPFLDKIAGVAGPPVGEDLATRSRRDEYIQREGRAATGAKHIRAEIEKRKAAPKR